MSLLLMKRRQAATPEQLMKEKELIRRRADVSDDSEDDDDPDPEIDRLQSRVNYSESHRRTYETESSGSESDSGESGSDTRRDASSSRTEFESDDYDSGYDDSESDWDDQRHEMQKKIQKKYHTPSKFVKSIEIQKRKLDTENLSLKKVEAKKKLSAVWEGIIQRYSVLGEDEQGDIVNLKNMCIEENTGHIEQLQTKDRTTIWDDFVEESEGEIGDPLNLLTATPRKKSTSGLVTPISMRSGFESRSFSKMFSDRSLSPPKFQLKTSTHPNKLEEKKRWHNVEKESVRDGAVVIELSSESETDDDVTELEPINSQSDPFNSPRHTQRSTPVPKQDSLNKRHRSQCGTADSFSNDPMNLLTPKKRRVHHGLLTPTKPLHMTYKNLERMGR